MGKYREASRFFKDTAARLAALNLTPLNLPVFAEVYKYYSQVMHAACLHRQGDKTRIDELIKTGENQTPNWFLGYILLRLNYRTDLAEDLLADCPENIFGEVTYKWISYKLGKLALKKFRLAKYKLKKPEFDEKYDQIKLHKKYIPLIIKYFNPAEISLLKEICLYKASESLDSKDMEDFASLGQISYLFGDFKKGIRYLEDYKKAYPLDLSASIWLGLCYYAADYPQKANRCWDWIKKSGGPAVKRKLALVFSIIEKKQGDAIDLILATRDKKNSKKIRFDVGYYRRYEDYYWILGRVYLNQRRFKEAGDTLMLIYERSRKEQPQTYDQNYLLCLGYALAKSGRFKESIDYALKGAASLDTAVYQAFHAVNYGLYMLKHE
jgi:tetratricopeptide (TPR) repeat protein